MVAISQMETRCRANPARIRVRLLAEFREENRTLVCWDGVGLDRGLRLRHRRDRVESPRRGTSLSGLWTQDPLEVFSGAQHLPELRRAALISSPVPAIRKSFHTKIETH